MSRKNKKAGINDFLFHSGVLNNGTPEEIESVKKKYWSEARKEWKRKRRAECKSYAVFLSIKEQNLVREAIGKNKISITRFIKESALNTAANKSSIDRDRLGKIRQVFFDAYNETITKPDSILNRIINLEETVLTILQQ